MTKHEKSIIVVRNQHPYEVSAFYLAPKVAKKLSGLDYKVSLETIPFGATDFGRHILGGKLLKDKELNEANAEKASDLIEASYGNDDALLYYFYKKHGDKALYLNFHNYPLINGINRSNLAVHLADGRKIDGKSCLAEEELKEKIKNFTFGFDEDKDQIFVLPAHGLSGLTIRLYPSISSAEFPVVEIPAVYKKISDTVLDNIKRYWRASDPHDTEEELNRFLDGPLQCTEVVDFKRTKELGLISDIIIEKLVKGIEEFIPIRQKEVKERKNK